MEIPFRSLSSSPASLSALSHRRQRHAARRRAGSPPAKSDFASASRGAPTRFWTQLPARWSSLPSPRPRRSFARPPPRHRRGEPAAAPRTPNSRALRNPEHRSLLFPSLFFGRSPLQKPRTEPPPSASSPAKPRRGDTTSRPLYPKPNPLIEHSSSHEALKPV